MATTQQHIRFVQPRYTNEAAQRDEYGGFHWGSAFFGWITATGVGVLLVSILGAIGSAVALTNANVTSAQGAANAAAENIGAIGLIGGLMIIISLAVAYYAGGYVAGRMSRFDGARQGLAVWILGILITLLLGAAGAALGSQFNLLQGLNLPSLPTGASFTRGGLITSIVALLAALGAAILGGKAGTHYHRKIDATGVEQSYTRDHNRSM